MPPAASENARRRSFSLLEIMVTVVIIGLLAALAVAAMMRHEHRARNTRFANDLRVIRDSIEQFGFTAGISVYKPTVSAAQMQEIDKLIDDGNLGTGIFRSRSNGYIYIIQF
jgi:prepilin-type N-terminal cleavage/methylation domain-containing protein